jgi:hypothetical protein
MEQVLAREMSVGVSAKSYQGEQWQDINSSERFEMIDKTALKTGRVRLRIHRFSRKALLGIVL